MSIKNKLKSSGLLVASVNFLRRLFRKNKIKVKRGNHLKIDGIINGANVVINGKGNKVIVKKPQLVKDLKIFINGNNNLITIEKGCVLNCLNAWIEDDGGAICIGENTMICGETELACIEGCKIEIGKDCMFSSGIRVVTGDSHSILNEKGDRINPSKDILIKDHVWVGYNANVLKGVTIASNSIVGARAVVTKSFEEQGVVVAGNPAKIVKENINWDKHRLPIKENDGR